MSEYLSAKDYLSGMVKLVSHMIDVEGRDIGDSVVQLAISDLHFAVEQLQGKGEPESVTTCPYCNEGQTVTITTCEPDVEMGDGEQGDWAEGDCSKCGRHVEYDYDPTGIVRFENGGPVYA